MRILFIGGTSMTGPFAVRSLVGSGHEVWLLHRSGGDSPLLKGATQIQADKADLPKLRNQLLALRLDVVVHMVAFTSADAALFVDVVAGLAPRAVVVSSIDVYRAYGRLHGTEPGPPDEIPLHEDAPLRSRQSVHGEAYDKTAVERIVQSDPKLPCTILRYPAVYGPGDRLHRLHDWVRRMDDRRPFILMGKRQAVWRFTHGYVENVADALVLAITHSAATGRIYNVGESEPPAWAEWGGQIGVAASWNGRVRIIPDERLPPHLVEVLDFRQDWVVDTSRIRSELGFVERVERSQCLERAVAWERSHRAAPDPKEFDYVAEDAIAAEFIADD